MLAVVWLVLWTLVSMLEFTGYIHDPRSPWWQWVVLVAISTTIVGTWLAFDVHSVRTQRPSLLRPADFFTTNIKRLPLLIVGGIVLVYGIRHAVFHVLGANYWHLTWKYQVLYEAIKISLFYGLWMALAFGTLTLARWREDSERMLATQKALAEAQLAQLQAQLHPHFLFNALNTVSSLMQTDPARADRVLTQLGDLLRSTLASNRPQTVVLREELATLQRYAAIMQERFEGRVRMQWDVSAEAATVPVPPMILQPLLENAFRHGVERSSAPVDIHVTARVEQGVLRVEIFNSGAHLAEGFEERVGIGNCRERLRLIYGSAATLTLSNANAGGVVASVILPSRRD